MKRKTFSLNDIKKHAGKWVAIHPKTHKIIASSDNIDDIAPLVVKDADDKKGIEEAPYSFLVPRKDEGPYVL